MICIILLSEIEMKKKLRMINMKTMKTIKLNMIILENLNVI